MPRIAGKYELLRKIASGGMAEVYLAKHAGIDGFEKLVVLKRILPKLAGKSEYVRLFLDEAKTAADLRHPNLVNTFEIGEDDGSYFMIMEYLQGQDVRSIFLTSVALKNSVPHEIALGIVMDACSGLHYAHSKKSLSGHVLGIVHRDISPHNMIITYEGQTKIVDFGIAKSAHAVEGENQVLRGKYSYMSPEQVQGLAVDHRTDIFGLGIVLFEMTTLQRLFRRESDAHTLRAVVDCVIPDPRSLLPEYPAGLAEIVLRALRKGPNDRYQTCEEFRRALEGFLRDSRLSYSPSRLAGFMRELFPESMNQDKTLEFIQPSAVPVVKLLDSSLRWNDIVCTIALLFVIILNSPMLERISAVRPVIELGTTACDMPLPKPAIVSPGRLKVVVDPWAEVFINGKKIGSTPLAAQSLDVGEYEVRLENPKLRRQVTKSITIASGQDTLLRHVW